MRYRRTHYPLATPLPTPVPERNHRRFRYTYGPHTRGHEAQPPFRQPYTMHISERSYLRTAHHIPRRGIALRFRLPATRAKLCTRDHRRDNRNQMTAFPLYHSRPQYRRPRTPRIVTATYPLPPCSTDPTTSPHRSTKPAPVAVVSRIPVAKIAAPTTTERPKGTTIEVFGPNTTHITHKTYRPLLS